MDSSAERPNSIDTSGSYFSLPKTIGEVPAPVLLDIAEKHRQIGQINNDRISMRHNEIASSAIVEAMLVSPDVYHLNVDANLEHIDRASDYLKEAIGAKIRLIEDGLEPQSAGVQLQRMLLSMDFMDVYRDIVCGEITNHTREELLNAFQHHLKELEQKFRHSNHDHDLKAQVSGLKGEVIVLQNYWQQRMRMTDPVALPATVRGGDGNERSSETHDVILFKEPVEGLFIYQGAREVKAGRMDKSLSRTLNNLIRYTNPILHVDTSTKHIREIL